MNEVHEGAPSTPAPKKFSLFKKILLALLVIVVGLIGVIALQPAEFRVARAAKIAAPPEAVFAQVNDFHKWEAWSPWAKLDPNAKNTFEGPSEGTGAVFHWAGNNEVGEGIMTILDSRPNELIKIKLEFLKPYAAICDTEFTFKPEGDQTAVNWSMKGQNDFMSKAMHLVMDMDKMVGGDFEKGLASMKSVAESTPKQ